MEKPLIVFSFILLEHCLEICLELLGDFMILTVSLSFTEKPSAPTRLGATEVTKDSITIAWSKPEHDGGSRVTSYLIDALEKGQEKWVKCAVVKTNTHTIKSLREHGEYFFRVRAENHAGLSEPKEMIVPVVVKDQLGKFVICIRHNSVSHFFICTHKSYQHLITTDNKNVLQQRPQNLI